MTPSEAAVFSAIAGSLFWHPKSDDEPAIGYLLAAGLIQPIRQGKLNGYALTPAGYVLWMGRTGRLDSSRLRTRSGGLFCFVKKRLTNSTFML